MTIDIKSYLRQNGGKDEAKENQMAHQRNIGFAELHMAGTGIFCSFKYLKRKTGI